MILLFATQKYSSFNSPYFPKPTLKFVLDSIPACTFSQKFFFGRLTFALNSSIENGHDFSKQNALKVQVFKKCQ